MVEVQLFQGQNTCVEITTETTGWVGVRDSKAGVTHDVLVFGANQWHALVDAARTRRFLG